MATVENIDYPSKPGISPDKMKAEYLLILDKLKGLGINALFFQVRPAADVFYHSSLEPPSRYWNPDTTWDPLPFLIEEAHRRNMAFHAWINPYRALTNTARPHPSPLHITNTHPEWLITYGTQKWFNPGIPDVWEYIGKVVKELITKYPVDGVHLDDYFYPYKIAGKPFPDNKTYQKYGNGKLLDDWRRQNVDTVIHLISNIIKAQPRKIQYGISPFGVWRNKSKDNRGSNTRAGMSNYDDLYADVILWAKNGWVDYLAPQLYWETGNVQCDFETLVEWWTQNSFGIPIYTGHAVYRAIKDPVKKWNSYSELPNQIRIAQKYPMVAGHIFYNTNSLLKNPKHFGDSLTHSTPKMPCP